MALFNRSLDQIKSLLGSMAFSQKMLIVTLLVIIIGCVAWMMNYAGRPEMVPVIDQQFSPEIMAQQSAALKADGMKVEIKDGRLLVPQGRQEQALAILAYSGSLAGQDISFGFQQLVSDTSMWRSEADKERMSRVADQNELASVLRLLPGVQEAKVIIDRPQRTSFGHNSDSAGSAAVHLRLKPGATIDRKMILAAADWISGAVRDVPRSRVKLIDTTNGRSFAVPNEDASIPADLLELTREHEEHLTRNILKAIGHIDNLLISVSVKVDPAGRQIKEFTPDKSKTFTPVSEESSTKLTSNDSGTAGEPGVVTNTATAVPTAAAAGGGTRRNETEDKTVFGAPVVATRETVMTEPAGAVKEVSASVNVPRSWFVAAMKAGGAAEVDGDQLRQFITEQAGLLKEQVMRAIGLDKSSEDRVVVGWYPDNPPADNGVAANPESAGILTAVVGQARTIGLGALAVISLLAMVLMMKKAASGATLAPPEPALAGATVSGPAVTYSASGPISREQPDLGEELLNVEVSQDTLRTQKMVEQVAGLVKQNPDVAANLVKRWVSKKQK